MEPSFPPSQLYILLAITVTMLSIASSILLTSSNEHVRRYSVGITYVAMVAIAFAFAPVFLWVAFLAIAEWHDKARVFSGVLAVRAFALGTMGWLARNFLRVISAPEIVEPERSDESPL